MLRWTPLFFLLLCPDTICNQRVLLDGVYQQPYKSYNGDWREFWDGYCWTWLVFKFTYAEVFVWLATRQILFISLQLIIFKCVKETERENRSSHSWQKRIATSLKAVGNGSNHRGNAQTHDGEDEGNLWTTLYICTILLGDTKMMLDIVNIVVCLTSPDFEQAEEGIHEQVRKLQIWWRLDGANLRRPPRRHTRGWYIVACLGHHICLT